MGLGSFTYMTPADAKSQGLTPHRTNYIDTYDWSTFDIPSYREAVIEKFNQSIDGFIEKYAGSQAITADQFKWAELESNKRTYTDAVITISGGVITLTRAASAIVPYRKHEVIQVHKSTSAGKFIVKSITSSTAVVLGTYDAGSETIVSGYSTAITAVLTYDLFMQVNKQSKGADFTAGVQQPYKVHTVQPTILRETFSEIGSRVPEIGWLKFADGTSKWYLKELQQTRDRLFRAKEVLFTEGEQPSATSDAAVTLGIEGSKGAFKQVRERGGTWAGQITSESDLDALAKHFDKWEGSGQVAFLCHRDQKKAFDTLGRTYNPNYSGDTKSLGEFAMSVGEKLLGLDNYAFSYQGYTFKNQVWKYLNENTFRGNELVNAANRVHAFMIPMGMQPVSVGDQGLAYNPRIQMNYMTKLYKEGRDYMDQMEGGFGIMGASTNGDDEFKLHLLTESGLALFNAEKFLVAEGNA